MSAKERQRKSTKRAEKSANPADCKRGRQKGGTSENVKNRQKVSKSFSTLFVDIFRKGAQKSLECRNFGGLRDGGLSKSEDV